jgi:hypothetical protein
MDSKTYEIFYNKELKAVVMRWEGYANSQQFREGTELMLKTLTENQADKVLADIEDMVLIGTQDQKWLDNEFLPRAIEMGFKALAIVRPKAYFNKVAVESVSYKVDEEKLKISFFDGLGKAKEWLKEVSV